MPEKGCLLGLRVTVERRLKRGDSTLIGACFFLTVAKKILFFFSLKEEIFFLSLYLFPRVSSLYFKYGRVRDLLFNIKKYELIN